MANQKNHHFEVSSSLSLCNNNEPFLDRIYWRVYNSIANTSKGVLFLPPSDAYVRSFLYLRYTLIKLYYTKALSNQAFFLALD